jgi:hypothetical protein
MAVKRMGLLGVSVWKVKALTVKKGKVTLTGKGRQDPTGFVYSVYDIIGKISSLSRCFLGVILYLDKYIFSWQRCHT